MKYNISTILVYSFALAASLNAQESQPIAIQGEAAITKEGDQPSLKDVFIQKLNKSLELEYAAAIQYIQHASLMTGPQYDAIAKELIVHAKEEAEHAITLTKIITDLGGTPSVDVGQRETSPDSKKMLEQDLAGEKLAITLYKELIQIADKLGEYGYRHQLGCILTQEEEHHRDLTNSLGR